MAAVEDGASGVRIVPGRAEDFAGPRIAVSADDLRMMCNRNSSWGHSDMVEPPDLTKPGSSSGPVHRAVTRPTVMPLPRHLAEQVHVTDGLRETAQEAEAPR